MLNTFLRRQGLKIEDLVDLINFETRSNLFDDIFFNKNYPQQFQLVFEKHKNQIRDIEFIKVSYDKIKLNNFDKNQITKENADLIDYFNNNSNKYTKKKREIFHILLNKNDFKKDFSPSDSKMAEYYNNNLNLFTKPEERSLSNLTLNLNKRQRF